jgi:hypothetical protein
MRKLLLLIAVLYIGCKDKRSTSPANRTEVQKPSELAVLKQTFRHKIDSLAPFARSFTKANGYNQQYVFIADLSLHSGYERFAVVDIKKDSIVNAGLVAHGAGGKYWATKARFSNVPNSLCSSPGKYRVGTKYDGRFGKAYKLHGLDKTNSKAFQRFIVLHAYDCVPDKMLYPGILCNSEGCPMVSYRFLATLSAYIDKSKKPILLWIIG